MSVLGDPVEDSTVFGHVDVDGGTVGFEAEDVGSDEDFFHVFARPISKHF